MEATLKVQYIKKNVSTYLYLNKGMDGVDWI